MKRLAILALAAALPLAAHAAGKTELTWYGHAAFVLKTPGGTVLAIDPWLSNPTSPDKEAAGKLEKVDFIVVTHAHADHVGDAVAIAKRTGAKLVGGFDLANALIQEGYPKEQATAMTSGNIGGTIALNDEVSVTIVPASHSSGIRKDGAPVSYGGNPTGALIHVKGGPTVYHTGDTDVTSDMKLVGDRWKIDYMLACIGGHFTMDPQGAATAAQLTRAKNVIPMHFGTFPLLKGTPEALEKAIQAGKGKAKVVTMKIGETRAL
jgi:L-ascorbate metabolism protein UlaG (beta-lactamase superfamily)